MNLKLSSSFDLNAWAEGLAREHCPEGSVDPERIARRHGIVVLHASLGGDRDGVLYWEGRQAVILCNTRLAARGSDRNRFTVAHELGHYFAEQFSETPLKPAARSMRSTCPEEATADRFAAHLLMPEEVFRREFQVLMFPGLEGVAELSEFFGTSLSATAFRALELGYFPAPSAVLVWDALGRSCGHRLSWETFSLGRDYHSLSSIPPPGSVTARAISRQSSTGSGASPAMAWFPRLHGYDRRHQFDLEEEVMARGEYGWITLLSGRSDAGPTQISAASERPFSKSR